MAKAHTIGDLLRAVRAAELSVDLDWVVSGGGCLVGPVLFGALRPPADSAGALTVVATARPFTTTPWLLRGPCGGVRADGGGTRRWGTIILFVDWDMFVDMSGKAERGRKRFAHESGTHREI